MCLNVQLMFQSKSSWYWCSERKRQKERKEEKGKSHPCESRLSIIVPEYFRLNLFMQTAGDSETGGKGAPQSRFILWSLRNKDGGKLLECNCVLCQLDPSKTVTSKRKKFAKWIFRWPVPTPVCSANWLEMSHQNSNIIKAACRT